MSIPVRIQGVAAGCVRFIRRWRWRGRLLRVWGGGPQDWVRLVAEAVEAGGRYNAPFDCLVLHRVTFRRIPAAGVRLAAFLAEQSQ
jgi:hypothetical protein